MMSSSPSQNVGSACPSTASVIATRSTSAVARSPDTRSSMNATNETVTATSAATSSLWSAYLSMQRGARQPVRRLLPARAVHVRNLVRRRLEADLVRHHVEIHVGPERHPIGVAGDRRVGLVVERETLRHVDLGTRLLQQLDHPFVLRRTVGALHAEKAG